MISDFLQAIRSYGQALSVTTRLGLWKYWFLPGLMGLVVGGLVLGSAWFTGFGLGSKVAAWYPFEFGSSFVEGAAPWLIRLLVMIGALLIFKHLLLVIVSPFMSMLSERVESHYVGATAAPFSLAGAVHDLARGLRLAIRNIIREILLVGLLTVLSFLGPLALITGVLIFLVQAYYAGFGNMDFALERRYNVSQSVRFVRSAKGVAIGNGLVFLLLIGSVVGILVAPAWSTIAATLDVMRIDGDETLP